MGDIYSLLCERANQTPGRVTKVLLGLNWTLAQFSSLKNFDVQITDTHTTTETNSMGLSFSPVDSPRILPWPGTLTHKLPSELGDWIYSWDNTEAAVAAAVINARINFSSTCLAKATLLVSSLQAPQHLAVFEHFAEQIAGANVVIIGRYPGLEVFKNRFNYRCLERRPGPGDLPDTAAEMLLPKADWVFITASSIANKTLPRLLSLCKQAKVVLMGPSVPWLPEWRDFGVHFLAGIEIQDGFRLEQIISEGGGTRIFGEGVRYKILALD